jgi:hypothetical protein
LLGVAGQFLINGAMGMQELVGDVGEHSGAPRRDAALGDQDEEPGEELEDVVAGVKLREFGEEVGGEVLRVIGGRREDACDLQAGMPELQRSECKGAEERERGRIVPRLRRS